MPQPAPLITLRNLSISAYNNGFTLWHYRANVGDFPLSLDDCFAPGTFAPANDMLALGDIINISCGSAGGAIAYIIGVNPVRLVPMCFAPRF